MVLGGPSTVPHWSMVGRDQIFSYGWSRGLLLGGDYLQYDRRILRVELRVGIFRLKIRPPHTHAVSLTLVISACSDSSMPLLPCTCLLNNSKWCLASFVSHSSCTVLLLRCFLLNITACTAAYSMGGRTIERNS